MGNGYILGFQIEGVVNPDSVLYFCNRSNFGDREHIKKPGNSWATGFLKWERVEVLHRFSATCQSGFYRSPFAVASRQRIAGADMDTAFASVNATGDRDPNVGTESRNRAVNCTVVASYI